MNDWGLGRVASPGAEVRKWRLRRKLSLRALANRVRWDHSQVWRIETGKVPLTYEMAMVLDQVLGAGTALVRAAASANGRVRPALLPAAPALVVGRDAELAALADGVREQPPGTPSVVAIDGPAGAGKTMLALRWAHEVAEQYGDGHLYADLGGFGPVGTSVTADAVIEDFLPAMGVSAIPDTAAGRAALYRSLLADRQVLVVLDNVRDLADIDRLMPASARCGVVVTSRRALSSLSRVGATWVTVGPLAESDSVTVVSNVIGAGRAAAEPDAVAALTRLCGHLPLALSVAAEQVAIYPHRRVADLVEELLEEEHRFCSWEVADLRAVFSWSYHDLGSEEARMFRLLGLHPGVHLSVAAVAALAGHTVSRARRLLHRLAQLHLIDIESEHVVRLHDLLRAYTQYLVRTEEDDEQRAAAIRRLVSWYVGTARAASAHVTPSLEPVNSVPTVTGEAEGVEPLVFTDDLDARAWYEAEVDNFGPITALALEHGPPGTAQQLATSLSEVGLLGPGGRDMDDMDARDEPSTTTAGRTACPLPRPRVEPGAEAVEDPAEDLGEDPGEDHSHARPNGIGDDRATAVGRGEEGAPSELPWGSRWNRSQGRWWDPPSGSPSDSPWSPPWLADAGGLTWGRCGFNGGWRHHRFGRGLGGVLADVLDDLVDEVMGDVTGEESENRGRWPSPTMRGDSDGQEPEAPAPVQSTAWLVL